MRSAPKGKGGVVHSERILLLTREDEGGQPMLQPFPHEATAAVKAEPVRRARKKSDEAM